MPRPLNKKAKFIFEAFNWAINQIERHSKSKTSKKNAILKKEEVDSFLFPKKAKYFYISLPKRKKKLLKIKPGTDHRIASAQLNGHKGGSTTAARYPKEVRQQWASKAGNSTLARYGSDFFRHIRKKRKHYAKRLKRIKIEE